MSDTFHEILQKLGDRFGVLAESDTNQLTVIAQNSDVAVGDLFLLPSKRGDVDRIYIFRTTQYANILNRALEVNDIARNKLTMPDSYFSKDLQDELLIELKGMVLGYSEYHDNNSGWSFHRPRRLPEHLSDVYIVSSKNPDIAGVMKTLMQQQLGGEGIFIGELLAGEHPLEGVRIQLPAKALSHHIGVFGRTGSGKSNMMMVLLDSILNHNQQVTNGKRNGQKASILAIDPHDEFRTWHSADQGKDGIRGIVDGYTPEERRLLVEPFYYLSAKNINDTGLERRLKLSRADVMPADLISVMEFSEQQISFANQYYTQFGENWIRHLLIGDTSGGDGVEGEEQSAEFLPGTIAAVQRRVGFLQHGHTRIFTLFQPERGRTYDSHLADIICSLEQGRVLIIDTTLMSELEQFLVTTIVARVLFALRKALRSAESPATLEREIRLALANDDENEQIGMRSFADAVCEKLESGELPYIYGDRCRTPSELPFVNVVVEEAPSILNPQRLKFGSVFRDISRQGRKFGIGLSVVSQQVSEIDSGILTQINTELTMALGNENERREAIRNASADMMGFERELQVMGKGQLILSASYKDVPLPIQVPEFDFTDIGKP